MVDSTGKPKNGRKKSSKLRYFFVNGQLHKSLHINRSGDTITSWCYPLGKRVTYTYSHVLKTMGKAYKMSEVTAIVNRSRITIERAIINGDIKEPQFTYGLNEARKKYMYMFSEQEVIDLHSYFLTVHRGRPRKDGKVTISDMPTRAEVRSMLRNEPVMGYLDDDGNFHPTWKAPNL